MARMPRARRSERSKPQTVHRQDRREPRGKTSHFRRLEYRESISATGVPNWPDGLSERYRASADFRRECHFDTDAQPAERVPFRTAAGLVENPAPLAELEQRGSGRSQEVVPRQERMRSSVLSLRLLPDSHLSSAVNSDLGGMPANGRINSAAAGSGQSSPLWTFADTVSFTQGRHSFKAGGEIRLSRSNGYSADSYPSVTLGAWGGNTTPLSSTTQFADVLPGFLGRQPRVSGGTAARTIASNMLYFFTGSVSTASTNYWINSAADATNGVWQDIATTDKRLRSQVANDYALFVKDDWKLTRRLTLNLGLRWEGYASPYIKEGFTSRIANQGLGLFGVHQPADPNNLLGDWLDFTRTHLPVRLWLRRHCQRGSRLYDGHSQSERDSGLDVRSQSVDRERIRRAQHPQPRQIRTSAGVEELRSHSRFRMERSVVRRRQDHNARRIRDEFRHPWP